jgi:mRNA interferase RelE/StbE
MSSGEPERDEPGRYGIVFSNAARKAFAGLPRQVQERIRPKIDALVEEPRPQGVEKLAGREDRYRIRIGDYGLIYAMSGEHLIVLVLRVAHSHDGYREGG